MIIDLEKRSEICCPFSSRTCGGAACPVWRFMPESMTHGYCGPGGEPSSPPNGDPPGEAVIVTEKQTTNGGARARVKR